MRPTALPRRLRSPAGLAWALAAIVLLAPPALGKLGYDLLCHEQDWQPNMCGGPGEAACIQPPW